ncbi:hypothetical protein RQP46_008698 [Phenoliferia psychrophenolica]
MTRPIRPGYGFKYADGETRRHKTRDKAQVLWEERLVSRRGERDAFELQAKVVRLEKELAGLRGTAGQGGASGAQTIEGAKANIIALEVELEEAETSLKDLTLTHADTQTSLASALSTLSTLTSRNTPLEAQLATPSSVLPNSPDKSSGIEARQLRARVEHLGRQLDAKAKELAKENHALARVSSEIQSIWEKKARMVGSREALEWKVERLGEDVEEAKAARASRAAASTIPDAPSTTNSGVEVSNLVATIQNLGREVEELRSENMALLLKFVAPVS